MQSIYKTLDPKVTKIIKKLKVKLIDRDTLISKYGIMAALSVNSGGFSDDYDLF